MICFFKTAKNANLCFGICIRCFFLQIFLNRILALKTCIISSFLIPELSTKAKRLLKVSSLHILTKQFPHHPWASPFHSIRQLHSPEACPGSTCSGPHVLMFSTTKRPSVGGTSGSAHGIGRLRPGITTPTLRNRGTASPRGVNTVQHLPVVYCLFFTRASNK